MMGLKPGKELPKAVIPNLSYSVAIDQCVKISTAPINVSTFNI